MTLTQKLVAETKKLPGIANTKHRLYSEEYVPQVMPSVLGTWDMTTTFIVSTFLSTCATTAAAGGPAALTYLVFVAIVFFFPCMVATLQLGVMFPYEGALYNWTHKALGGYWSFFAGFCAWFPCVLVTSSLADLIVTYVQAMHQHWLVLPWQQGLIICVVLIVSGIICLQRFRTVQHIVNALVCLMFVGSLLLYVASVVWLVSGHHAAINFASVADWRIGPENFALFGLIAFAYIGTEGPLNLAGETRGRHVIRPHLLWGGGLIFFSYMASTLAVLIVQGRQAAYNPFAIVTTIDMALGKCWGDVAAICFMGSFIATILVYNYICARLLMVASVDRHLPVALGHLNKYRVPANAIIFQTAIAIVFTILVFMVAPLMADTLTNFSIQVYNVSQAAAALIWAISAAFLFINLLGCYKRHRAYLMLRRVVPFPVLWVCVCSGLVSCLLIIVDILLFSWTSSISNGQWWYLVGSLALIFLLVATVGSLVAHSEAAWQDFRS